MTRIYHKEKVWDVKYYNDNLSSKRKNFHALVYAKMQDFDLEEPIVLEYKGKYYKGAGFGIRESISDSVELYIAGLVDNTRDIKIKLITNEKI